MELEGHATDYRIDSSEREKFQEMGNDPRLVRLTGYLSKRLNQIREENDKAEGISLTRNQGKALMLVELIKLLGSSQK